MNNAVERSSRSNAEKFLLELMSLVTLVSGKDIKVKCILFD